MEKSYKLKKIILMLKSSVKRMHKPNVSWFVFLLCILLMLMLLFPRFFQRVPIYEVLNSEMNIPYELRIHGNISLNENLTVYIHIGGYKEEVSGDGEYSLSFLSNCKGMIPVCITDKKGELLDFFVISFAQNEWSKEKNIYIGGK